MHNYENVNGSHSVGCLKGTAVVGSSSEETVVTDSSLAQNVEEGPVPKRPRKDLGPSSEETPNPTADSSTASLFAISNCLLPYIKQKMTLYYLKFTLNILKTNV